MKNPSVSSIGIVGNGVVGNATGKAFEKRGLEVRYWDIKESRSTHSLTDVIRTGIVFVCLPTPAYSDGSCDVTHLEDFFVNGPIRGERHPNFVLRSTAPIGYTKSLLANHGYTNIYHWPEFLTARTAEQDANNPRCLILGKPGGWSFDDQGDHHDNVLSFISNIFSKWSTTLTSGTVTGPHVYPVSSCESEAIKSFTNAFFAAKVSIFNEFRILADAKGLDWDTVVRGMLADQRIHPMHTLVPGPDGQRGFGGACLPKDIDSVIAQCLRTGFTPFTLNGAALTNVKIRPIA